MPESRKASAASTGKRNILINAGVNWTGFALTAVVTFYMAPQLVHGLGDRRYGTWQLVESVLAYLMLFDLGVGAAVLRYVARFEGLGDSDKLNRIFSTSLTIFGIGGLLALAISLGLALPFACPLGAPSDLAGDTRWLLILLGVNFALGLPLSVYDAALSGLGRYPILNAIKLGALLLSSTLMLFVLHTGSGLPIIGLVVTGCALCQRLAEALVTHYYLPSLRYSPRLVDRETFHTIRGYSTYVFIANLAGRLSVRSDAVVIGAFLGPQFVTFYMIAARLVDYAKETVISLTTVLTPAVSSWDARGKYQEIRGILVGGTRGVLYLVFPIQIGIWLFGDPFLTLWMDPEYATASGPVLAILSGHILLALGRQVPTRVLHGIGKVGFFSALSVGQAVVTLALSLSLVVPFGIIGVAWSVTLASMVHAVLVTICTCRLVECPVLAYYWRAFYRPFLASGFLTALWLLMRTTLPPTTWSLLILDGLSGLTLYALSLLVFEPEARHFLAEQAQLLRRSAGQDLEAELAEAPKLCEPEDSVPKTPEIAESQLSMN
jgi:O-antigen/teichoic acid export membrane protein